MPAVQNGADIIELKKEKVKEKDRETSEIVTMYNGLYLRSNVDRLYLTCNEGDRGFVSTEGCVSTERKSLALYASLELRRILSTPQRQS